MTILNMGTFDPGTNEAVDMFCAQQNINEKTSKTLVFRRPRRHPQPTRPQGEPRRFSVFGFTMGWFHVECRDLLV